MVKHSVNVIIVKWEAANGVRHTTPINHDTCRAISLNYNHFSENLANKSNACLTVYQTTSQVTLYTKAVHIKRALTGKSNELNQHRVRAIQNMFNYWPQLKNNGLIYYH